MADDRKSDVCRFCGGIREATLNRETGRAVVSVPVRCMTRDRCERVILPGFTPDPMTREGVVKT